MLPNDMLGIIRFIKSINPTRLANEANHFDLGKQKIWIDCNEDPIYFVFLLPSSVERYTAAG